MSRFTISIIALLAACSTPAFANSLIGPGPRAGIAKSRISASPAGEWNKLSLSGGKNVEVWTLDGDSLNKVTFFGGIAAGQPLLRERDKKNSPLPKVASNMLVTDIPTLLETTYRSQYAVNQMAIDTQAPAQLGGHAGIRFTYNFTKSDDVRRQGEAFGAMVNGQLYLVAYEAPQIYFFDRDIEKFRTLATSIKL
ncbi:hypothetical protein [Novosphingobium panipatense]|uniref:DUF1795 domain-containing protein n=2 Tax=Novosphingobium panipatense TaxID=428991 RepID=A0ABY1QML6_9SPHN|nr:hypothetical protein [Novosphingobium panipatense]SMP75602.1 hypothetical protein SAMN06296065_108103 [Novosphingobium panipatense]